MTPCLIRAPRRVRTAGMYLWEFRFRVGDGLAQVTLETRDYNRALELARTLVTP